MGRSTDVPACPFECPAQVTFLERGGKLGELFGEWPGQVHGKLIARGWA